MTPKEIAALYELPANTNADKLLGRLVRLVPAGAATLEAKEHVMGLLNRLRRERAPQAEGVAREALLKVLAIERAILAGLEGEENLPPGTLTDYQKNGGVE